MPEPGPQIVRTRERGALNDAQRRRLSVTCKYIDNCFATSSRHSILRNLPLHLHGMLWTLRLHRRGSSKTMLTFSALNCCAHWTGNT